LTKKEKQLKNNKKTRRQTRAKIEHTLPSNDTIVHGRGIVYSDIHAQKILKEMT